MHGIFVLENETNICLMIKALIQSWKMKSHHKSINVEKFNLRACYRHLIELCYNTCQCTRTQCKNIGCKNVTKVIKLMPMSNVMCVCNRTLVQLNKCW